MRGDCSFAVGKAEVLWPSGAAAAGAPYKTVAALAKIVIPMSGYTPPPGGYFSDTFYLYSASAATNGNFPFGRITAGIKVNFFTSIAATAAQAWNFATRRGSFARPDRARHTQ